MTDIRRLHKLVWDTRRELGEAWPTPEPIDALRFALTEAGEAMDAWLRTNPLYRRNNEKTLSVHAELADCAMMLLTALGPEIDVAEMSVEPANLETICLHVANICNDAANYGKLLNHCRWWTCRTVAAIGAYPGMDLPAELTARLARIMQKHG